jgi:hypothetical protein
MYRASKDKLAGPEYEPRPLNETVAKLERKLGSQANDSELFSEMEKGGRAIYEKLINGGSRSQKEELLKRQRQGKRPEWTAVTIGTGHFSSLTLDQVR